MFYQTCKADSLLSEEILASSKTEKTNGLDN